MAKSIAEQLKAKDVVSKPIVKVKEEIKKEEVKDHIPPGSRSEAEYFEKKKSKIEGEPEVEIGVAIKIPAKPSPWQKVHVTKEIRIQTPDMTALLTISISPKGTVSLKTPNSASKVITPKQLDELIAGTEVAKMLALSAPNKKD